MDLYLAGGESRLDEYMRSLGCNRLFSNLNDRKQILNWVEFLRANPQYPGKFLIDSGAYSAFTKGKTVDVDDYISFINEVGDVVDLFAQVDHIQSPMMSDEEKERCQQDTWENYLYMIDRIKPEYVDKLIPLYHAEEDIKRLYNLLEWTHEDGHHIKYIGLGAPQTSSQNIRAQYFDEWFKIIKDSHNPNVCTHAFGCTDLEILEMFPFTSADSTAWVIMGTRGHVFIKNKYFSIGEKAVTRGENYMYQPTSLREFVDRFIEDRGFTTQQLKEDSMNRLIFNIKMLKEWQDTYVCRYNPSYKKACLF